MSTNQPNVLTGHNGLVVSVVKAFYQVLSNVTHTVGLTPIELGMGLAGLVIVMLVFVFIQGFRGKTNFSLDPKHTRRKENNYA